MKTTYITTSASICIIIICISIYKYITNDITSFTFFSQLMGYLGVQLIIGIIIFGNARTEKVKRIGQGLMIGAGIVGLIGFSICTSNFMKS